MVAYNPPARSRSLKSTSILTIKPTYRLSTTSPPNIIMAVKFTPTISKEFSDLSLASQGA
jgi:hypothetical protein